MTAMLNKMLPTKVHWALLVALIHTILFVLIVGGIITVFVVVLNALGIRL